MTWGSGLPHVIKSAFKAPKGAKPDGLRAGAQQRTTESPMLYRFEAFELDLDLYELRRSGKRIPIQRRSFDVLRYLLENPDRTVPKSELLDELWPGVAVGEAALTQAISLIRRALDEQDKDEGVVRTVRGRGYRVGVPVEIEADERSPAEAQPVVSEEADLEAEAPVEVPPSITIADERSDAVERQRRSSRTRLLSVAGLAALVVVLGLWLASPRLEPPPSRLRPTSAPAARTSIAVLPFADLSPARDQGHFSDGISEEIINALAQVDGLRVVARTSAFAFKGRDDDVRSIGVQLAVGSIVEGSVRQDGDRFRITAQLVSAANGFHLWSASYDERLEDVFDVQARIARAVVEAVQGRLHEPLPATAPIRRDFRAFELYLRARAAANLRTREGILAAIEYQQEALEIEPDYAEAHAGLADAYALFWDYLADEPRDGPILAKALASAERAVALDPNSAESLLALGHLRSVRFFDHRGAERLFQRALELKPAFAAGHERYSSLLMHTGRLDEARVEILTSLELDPLSPTVHRHAGRFHLYASEYDEALEFLWHGVHLNPQDPLAPLLLWITYSQLDREQEALDALLVRAFWWSRAPLRIAGRLIGTRSLVRVALEGAVLVGGGPCPVQSNTAAQGFAYVGNQDRMFECLDQALQRDVAYFKVNPLFAPYRSDPRFVSFLQSAGLAAR